MASVLERCKLEAARLAAGQHYRLAAPDGDVRCNLACRAAGGVLCSPSQSAGRCHAHPGRAWRLSRGRCAVASVAQPWLSLSAAQQALLLAVCRAGAGGGGEPAPAGRRVLRAGSWCAAAQACYRCPRPPPPALTPTKPAACTTRLCLSRQLTCLRLHERKGLPTASTLVQGRAGGCNPKEYSEISGALRSQARSLAALSSQTQASSGIVSGSPRGTAGGHIWTCISGKEWTDQCIV